MNVEASGLSKWYGQVIGVNDLTFAVTPGVTGFLGPNGAGKTTLLRLMTGQLRPDMGSVTVGGERVWNNYRILREIGYCPELDSFWNFMNGTEFVCCLLRIHGYPAAEAREKAAEAVRTMGMEKAGGKKIGSYSRGMRQRIKMAQAIAHDPAVYFLDEPLNGMDPIGRHKTIELIREFGSRGKTVVVSSHVLHEVEQMTDKILLVNHGHLLAEGNIYDIRRLIDTHPLQVSIRCDNVNVLTSRLLEYEDIKSVNFDRERNQLTVETTNPDEFHLRLPSIALENGIEIKSLWSPDENLEAIFDYLVR